MGGVAIVGFRLCMVATSRGDAVGYRGERCSWFVRRVVGLRRWRAAWEPKGVKRWSLEVPGVLRKNVGGLTTEHSVTGAREVRAGTPRGGRTRRGCS